MKYEKCFFKGQPHVFENISIKGNETSYIPLQCRVFRLIPRSAGFLLECHIFVSCLRISMYIYIFIHMYFIPISLIHMYICKYSIFCIIYHIYVQLLRSTAAPWQVEFPSLWSFQPPFCRSKTMTMTTLPKSVEGQQKTRWEMMVGTPTFRKNILAAWNLNRENALIVQV